MTYELRAAFTLAGMVGALILFGFMLGRAGLAMKVGRSYHEGFCAGRDIGMRHGQGIGEVKGRLEMCRALKGAVMPAHLRAVAKAVDEEASR